MFYLSGKTCLTLTFAQVLIIAAMNAEDIRIGSEDGFCTKPVEMQREYFSARHSQVRVALPE